MGALFGNSIYRVWFYFFVVLGLALVATQAPEIAVKHGEFVFNNKLENNSLSLESALVHWDVKQYLLIAENGYGVSPESAAFFPLWPALLKMFRFLGKDSWLYVALVWQLTMWAAAFYLMGKVFDNSARIFGGLRWMTLLFPASIFFVAPYPEITFVVLVNCALYSIQVQNKWGLMASLILLIATKHISMIAAPALIAPLFLLNSGKPLRVAAVMGVLLGWIFVFGFFAWTTGHALSWITAQSQWGRSVGTPLHFLYDLGGKALDWALYSFLAGYAWYWSFCVLYKSLKANRNQARLGLELEHVCALFFAIAVLTPVVWGTSVQSIYRIVMIAFPGLICIRGMFFKGSKTTRYLSAGLWVLLTLSNIYKFSSGLHLP
jgi:hypothetical protein